MLKKCSVIALALALTLGVATFASAQDEDVFGLTGKAGGEYPVVLENNTEYEFAFEVFNTNGGDVAIQKVEISLPNTNYALDSSALVAPEALHSGNVWTVDWVSDSATIAWESMGGKGSSAEVGDIREGEVLTFTFTATTDSAKAASDGFPWTLTGDDNGATVVSDVWTFAGGDGDDDDTSGDDDSGDEGDDDDDDDSCGC